MTASAARGNRYAWFVVALLMLAYVLSFVDRQILNLLVGPIRHDLAIGETQMSLLMGLSFAVFYTLCGLPIARWADTGSRRLLIAGGVFFWSVATTACGMAKTYGQMFLARIGVGVGEAALSPAAYSMITDYFPKELRATAISVYSMGIYLGSGLAFLVGGAVIQFASTRGELVLPLAGEIRPWQLVFFILGIVGVAFSVLLLIIREPARTTQHVARPLADVIVTLKANASTLLCHHFGFALIALAAYASSAWVPSYFIRVHAWTAAETGLIYGTLLTIFGPLGIVAGGRIADHWIQRGHTDATLRVGLWAALLNIPCITAFLLCPDPRWAMVLLAPCVFFVSMPFGVAPAGLQDIVPASMRAQVSALYLFVVNMIGLGLGPTAVAVVTEYVFKDDAAVGRSLLLISLIALSSAALLLKLGQAPYRSSYTRQHGT